LCPAAARGGGRPVQDAAKLKHRPDRVNHRAPGRCIQARGKLFANKCLTREQMELHPRLHDGWRRRTPRAKRHPDGTRASSAERAGGRRRRTRNPCIRWVWA